MYILNRWFLFLWVGEQYFVGQQVLFLALIIMVQHNILHVSGLSLYGIGIVKGISLMGLAEALLNLVLTIWLGKIYGIQGILIATIIACWLTVMWYVPFITMKNLKIELNEYLLKPLLIPILAISGLGAIFYFFTNYIFDIIPITWLSFSVISFITALLLMCFVWIVFLRKEFSEYIPVRLRKYLLFN